MISGDSILAIFLNVFQSVVILLNFTLGFITYLEKPKSYVNKVFFYLITVANIWIFGFILIRIWDPLGGLKILFAGASLISPFLLDFALSFPKRFSPKIFHYLKSIPYFLGIIFVYLCLFSDLVISGFKYISENRIGFKINYGAFYSIFGAFFIFNIIFFISFLVLQFKKAEGVEKKQALFVIIGMLVAVIPGTVTNLLIPIFTGSSSFSQFGNLFISLFVVFCFYAIIKHGLFSLRIIATEIFVVILGSVLLFDIFLEKQSVLMFFKVAVFLSVVFFGFLLIRSISKEIQAKEKIAKLLGDLEIANVELQKLDKAKSEFLDIASHQLRTPVSVIKGVASMIREGDLDRMPKEKRDVFIQGLWEKSQKMEDIIEDILNASEMTSAEFQFSRERAGQFDLLVLLKKIAEGLEPKAAERKISLKIIEPKETLPKIFGQKDYIEEAVSNLVDNAIKYTPQDQQGVVEISAAPDGGNAIIKVRDNGIGIPKGEQAKIFRRFERASNARDMYTDGTGLGLFIAKEIVEGHGGKIWLESELNNGTTISISLPISADLRTDVKKYIFEKQEV